MDLRPPPHPSYISSLKSWLDDLYIFLQSLFRYDRQVSPYEVDHGAAGQGFSLYDILTNIGTTTKATVVFKRAGTYTVSSRFNASSYTNVYFQFEPGAVLSVADIGAWSASSGLTWSQLSSSLANGVWTDVPHTLILPSPSHIIASPTQQIFSGAGTVTFDSDGEKFPDWWYSSGTWVSAFNSAIGAFSGGLVKLNPHRDYSINAALTGVAHTRLVGSGRTQTRISLVGVSAQIPLPNHSQLQDFMLIGDSTAGQVAILNDNNAGQWSVKRLRIDTVDVGIELSNTWIGQIEDVYIYDGGTGIHLSATNSATASCNNINIRGGSIHACDTGILIDGVGLTVASLLIDGTNIEDNADYGIRQANGTTDITVRNAWVEGNQIGIQFEASTDRVSVEKSLLYNKNDAGSKGIVFTAGSHTNTRIINNSFNRAGASSTTAIEFSANVGYPVLVQNSYVTGLAIVDNSTTGITRIGDDGNNSETLISRFQHTPRRSNKTADFNVTADETCYIYSNPLAAATITGSLPVAATGLIYTFINSSFTSGYKLRIDPNGTEAFMGGSGAGKYLELDPNESVMITCVRTGYWNIIGGYGTPAFE